MSTISDALQKVQKQRAAHEPERWRPEPLDPSPSPPLRRVEAPPQKARGTSVAGIVLAVLALMLVGGVVMMRCSPGNATRPSETVASIQPPVAAVAGQPPTGTEAAHLPVAAEATNSPVAIIAAAGPSAIVARVKEPAVAEVVARGDTSAPPVIADSGVREPAPVKSVEVDKPAPVESVEAEESAGPVEVPHKLVGIFYSEKNPVAIIDNLTLKEGETIGAYRVAKIQSESVTLRSGRREVVLRLQ